MQHIAHIFIGDEMVAFRDTFASDFRRLHSDFEKSLFSALSLTPDTDNRLILSPDADGDRLDGACIDMNENPNGLSNFFEDLYSRKVTVVNPGNQSMVVMIWAKLFHDKVSGIVNQVIKAITSCTSNFHIEICGFTNDAISCFIADPIKRLAPDVYKQAFNQNLKHIMEFRPHLAAFRLISDRNMDNVGLGFNERSMAFVCAAFSAIMCRHYLSVHQAVIDSLEVPFETFGISSIIFDVDYYKSYIRRRIIIDRLSGQGITERSFNINTLAMKTNPALNEILEEIHDFYDTKVSHAKAALSLGGSFNSSEVVASIDKEIKEIVDRLNDKVDHLLSDGSISIFEKEALLALISGDDCSMFESSAVSANETTIDDILDESVRFFIQLDKDHSILTDVSQDKIMQIRNNMRNIAVANRNREEKLAVLNRQQKDSVALRKHIVGNEYNFGDVGYKLDLNIDTVSLDQIYQPHDITESNIDLRNMFAPVRNQGSQGSCASFAVSSVIEALSGYRSHFSPAFLYWNARVANNSTSTDCGASLFDIIKAATQKGVCKEENMPYNPAVFTNAPSEAAISEAVKCKVVEAKSVETKIKDIKSALADGFPVIIAAKIFDSFSETKSGFVRMPSDEELKGKDRSDGHGTHAMVVCGFSDEDRIFVVRNSWGTDFGDKGYCYIPYAYAQQYFLQACIITELSGAFSSGLHLEKQTINFNMNDSNIEAAVIQNLVDEDKFELNSLAEQSAALRTDWTQNVAILGNVNNQADIVKDAKLRLDDKISKENSIINSLQNSKNDKLNEYKRQFLGWIITSGILALLLWLAFFSFDEISLFSGLAGFFSIVFVILIGAFSYAWRSYRQRLRDEIQSHSDVISRIEAEKASLDIKAHLHGTILREVDTSRSRIRSALMLYKAFNDSWIKIYHDTINEFNSMSPEVPYPFMAVLDNKLLDNYYQAWKHKLVDSIDFDILFNQYSSEANLSSILRHDKTLDNAIAKGLRDFCMKEYVTMQNNSKWQFLPDSTRMAELIPALDYRAKPFCTYNRQEYAAMEKFIFIHNTTQEDLLGFQNYFSQKPMLVPDPDPYAISILNVVRYNLSY